MPDELGLGIMVSMKDGFTQNAGRVEATDEPLVRSKPVPGLMQAASWSAVNLHASSLTRAVSGVRKK